MITPQNGIFAQGTHSHYFLELDLREGIRPDPLLKNIPEGTYFYFVHSFYVEPEMPENILRWTDYGHRFCSIAHKDNVWGAQFHPEKSQNAGKQLLRNFLTV